MVSFTVGTKSMRRSQPLLIKVGAKSTSQHDGCNIYYNKRCDLYNKEQFATTVTTSINKRLCQQAADKSPIESTMVWLGRCHLAFAVANCVLNLRFAAALLDAAVTAGSCDRLMARPAIWRKMLFLFYLLFFSYNSNKPRSQRESCLFSTSGIGYMLVNIQLAKFV